MTCRMMCRQWDGGVLLMCPCASCPCCASTSLRGGVVWSVPYGALPATEGVPHSQAHHAPIDVSKVALLSYGRRTLQPPLSEPQTQPPMSPPAHRLCQPSMKTRLREPAQRNRAVRRRTHSVGALYTHTHTQLLLYRSRYFTAVLRSYAFWERSVRAGSTRRQQGTQAPSCNVPDPHPSRASAQSRACLRLLCKSTLIRL